MKKGSVYLPIAGRSLPGRLTRRGTTLVEVLVVIVILLIGILAVLQIFPKGFLILSQARKSAQSAAMARDVSERLKTLGDSIPDQIVAVGPLGYDPNATVDDLGPAAPVINSSGNLETADGTVVGPWALFTGANRFRRIIGEKHTISSPRLLQGGITGCPVLPSLGTVDTLDPIVVNGPELNRNLSLPNDLTRVGVTDFYATAFTFGGFDYFAQPAVSGANIFLPSGATARRYTTSFYGFVDRGGVVSKRYFRSLSVNVTAAPANPDGSYPLLRVDLAALVSGSLLAGETLGEISFDSLKVFRAFNAVSAFGDDPFEYMVGDAGLGLLVFNPNGRGITINSARGREPLSVSLDYTVRDWRILLEAFRLTEADGGEYKLPLGNLKTNSLPGADGSLSPGIYAEGTGFRTQLTTADHFVLVDETTGGIVCERDPDGVTPYVRIDKSLGLLDFVDMDATIPGIQIQIASLPIGQPHSATAAYTYQRVSLAGRPLRAYYASKDEWAVQVLKPAAQYFQSPILPIGGEFYLGQSNGTIGGAATRIYFARSDANQKVTIGELNYTTASGRQQAFGKDFVIRFRSGDPIGLPSVDITDVDSAATGFYLPAAPPVKGVKGASITVRSMWNPDFFTLGAQNAQNIAALERWGRGWRRNTVQTFIERGGN